ncbi:MAG: tetratricopeptide repeat protein [Chitinophaga sp.]|uniref:tetratricopeptide repeat protein n=1 Tax=Chitinophaga sp. TaxID=1869181 RepID=UPI001B298934|nr:tetratricopeptide repeat protein [Chitinophaga sp.]MBO9730192.1 tetratricopeptide repeat protein [Chitinophaga sp.]
MKRYLSLFLLCSSIGVMQASAQTNAEKAREKVTEAVKLMDDGKAAESIPLLEEAMMLDPDNNNIRYEKSYALYMMKDYKAARNLLKKLRDDRNLGPNVYQLLGNTYDDSGDPKQAIKTYEEGIKEFPEAGNLYLERGVMEMKVKDYGKALNFFEKGIEAAPMFPSNYYRAATLFCLVTNEKVWGVMYGEIFMNLEPNTARTAEISKLLFDTYKSQITFSGDTGIAVSFSKNRNINITYNVDSGPEALMAALKQIKVPFGTGVYEPTLAVALAGEHSVDLASLSRTRDRFLQAYEQLGHQQKTPVVLFDFQREVKAAGHLEAYNYWLLSEGDKVAFNHWELANNDKWRRFAEWFSEHHLTITADNKFNMTKY